LSVYYWNGVVLQSQATPEEAYLIGCLIGRGVTQRSGNQYRLIFRIPFREFDPVGREIVGTLLQHPTGRSHSQLLNLSVARAKNLRNLGNRLGRLRRWNPPTRIVPGNLIEKVGARWRIGDNEKAREYLRRQKRLLDREHSAIKEYVLRHLTQALSSVSNHVDYSEDVLSFGITDHAISVEIDRQSFNQLRTRYHIGLGEVHRTNRLPSIIYASPRNVQEEFVRGLADIIGSFDKWLDMWRVQFSILENESFCVDLCKLFQINLEIPVHYIEWNRDYMDRGSRDILLKIWTPNAAQLTNEVVFHNRIKQTEFLDNLEATRATIAVSGRPTMFNPCPRNPNRLPMYATRCIDCGCTQI
jgi:hypothetical protein